MSWDARTTALIGIPAALLGLGIAWMDFQQKREERSRCTVSGVAFSGAFGNVVPVEGAEIGYDILNPAAPRSEVPAAEFRRIGVSGPGGTFTADCTGIVTSGSWIIVANGGRYRQSFLPCLVPGSTGQAVRGHGNNSGLQLRVPNC